MTANTFMYSEVFYNRKPLRSTLGGIFPVPALKGRIETRQDETQAA
jgi:hypothetical protein